MRKMRAKRERVLTELLWQRGMPYFVMRADVPLILVLKRSRSLTFNSVYAGENKNIAAKSQK